MGYLLSMRLQLSARVIAVVTRPGVTSAPAAAGDKPRVFVFSDPRR
jgi:hypothetical protein